MQFLNNSIYPAAPALSFSGWYACRRPVIRWGLLAVLALLFSLSLLNSGRQAAKRQSRWSVFAVMDNEGNDSEFENMLMTPLETAIPLNLEEAVFPTKMRWNDTVQGNGWNVGLRPPYSKTGFHLFCLFDSSQSSSQHRNRYTSRCIYFIEKHNVPVSVTSIVQTEPILRLRESQVMHISWQTLLPWPYGSFEIWNCEASM